MRNAKHKPIISACLSFKKAEYSLSGITETTGLKREYVRQRLWKFQKEELIDIVRSCDIASTGRGRPTLEIYYRNTGLLKTKPRTQKEETRNLWDKLWQAVRALRRFTRDDLIQVCEASAGAVKAFTQEYRDMGYIRPTRGHRNNITWTLVKDPGPKRPVPEMADVD